MSLPSTVENQPEQEKLKFKLNILVSHQTQIEDLKTLPDL
jgi:hypothetical protein